MVASIGKVTDPGYYTGEVAQDRHDYYAGHGEAPGRWTGAFAAALGLEGQVDTEAFADVLSNVDPFSGGKLKPRDNYKTLAYDVTFSPVKSVSVLWAVAPEPVRAEVLAALEGGHAEAVAYLERAACVARLGRDGSDPQPGVGFAAAVFRHRFSREADPQQHVHTVIANVTQAPDGRRAALDGTLLWQHAQVADARMTAYVHAELARRLGVGWEPRRGHWEVQGVPAGLCWVMSKRRVQIEQDQAERGGEGARDAQGAALRTRQAKQTAPDARTSTPVGPTRPRRLATTLPGSSPTPSPAPPPPATGVPRLSRSSPDRRRSTDGRRRAQRAAPTTIETAMPGRTRR